MNVMPSSALKPGWGPDMEAISKQSTGFRFGKNPTRVVHDCGAVIHSNGLIYKLLLVEADGNHYYCLRLYNANGRFIKQLFFEPDIIGPIADLLQKERGNAYDKEGTLQRSRSS
jgi:hypothetical protein